MFSAEYTRRILLATLVAALAASMLRLLADVVSGPLLVAGRGSAPVEVTTGPVVLATALGGLAAWLLARLSVRTGRPRRTFLGGVAAGLVLSAAPPLGATTTATTLWLLALHAAVAACLVPPVAALLPAVRVGPGLSPAAPAGRP